MDNQPGITLLVAGMSCGHCVNSVRRALEHVPGIEHADVAVGSVTLSVGPDAHRDDVRAAAVRAIAEAGYDAESRAVA